MVYVDWLEIDGRHICRLFFSDQDKRGLLCCVSRNDVNTGWYYFFGLMDENGFVSNGVANDAIYDNIKDAKNDVQKQTSDMMSTAMNTAILEYFNAGKSMDFHQKTRPPHIQDTNPTTVRGTRLIQSVAKQTGAIAATGTRGRPVATAINATTVIVVSPVHVRANPTCVNSMSV